MKTYYLIFTYPMIGAELKAYQKVELREPIESKVRGNQIISIKGSDGVEYEDNYYAISNKPEGYEKEKYPYLPYIATVTEDLPPHLQATATIYKNCWLMSEKHGGYLQFFHPETQKVLRIAMNSHYYEPVNQTLTEFETEILILVANKLNITESDASAILDANPLILTEAWMKNNSALEVCETIINL